MRHTLNIDYPPEKMEANRRRMEARRRFETADRVPVSFCVVPRYFAPIFGLPYQDFFKDVETQFYCSLQFAKYRIENIPDDAACHAPVVAVYPYFDNVVNASAFGAEIAWPKDETLQAIPTIHTVEQMERLEIPAPDAGLWGRVRDWWSQMRELASQTRLTFNGAEGRVEVGTLSIGGEGPHMIAIDLAGPDFYWWMLEYPEACHRFLDKITTGMIQAETAVPAHRPPPARRLRHRRGLVADHVAQACSASSCVPYDNRLFDAFGRGLADGRGMHMCGISTHLHRALVEDERITSFNVFGYQVPPEVAARNLGGRAPAVGQCQPDADAERAARPK